MKTKRMLAALPAALPVALLLSAGGQAQAAENLGEAITKGKWGLDFRYRYEYVDQEDFVEDANAGTLRTRLNFKTDDWKGFSVFAEVDYLWEIGPSEFNAGGGNTPDRTQFPVVADPEGFDLNQVFAQYKGGGSQFRIGRQRIIYDNDRFVGNVGWRQNEQTYDAVSYRFQHDSGIDVQLAYVDQVNRIFGDDVPAGRHDNETWLINAAKGWEKYGKLTGYYYDIDNEDAAAFSTKTYGARWAGKQKLSAATLGYTVEFARQSDAYLNPVNYNANYYRLDFSANIAGFTPYIGFESLGGDDTRPGASFRTPLATLHAFNGWADKFLATPAAGLEDLWIGAKGKAGTWSWNVLWHDFSAESGGDDFGQELDASIGTKFKDHFGVLFKVAMFEGERQGTYPDTTKVWIQFTAGF